MKKYITMILPSVMIISIFGLIGSRSYDKSFNNPFIIGIEREKETQPKEAQPKEISDELAYHAYDAIFSLSFATLEAGVGDNGITVEEDGGTSTYSFENTVYLKDVPEATVKGYMKAIDGETTDQSDVSFTFTNDPAGLETITIKSNGPHGRVHNEGTIIVNGVERSFLEFVEYFGSKLNQQSPLAVQGTE